jgi:hypothetical protein
VIIGVSGLFKLPATSILPLERDLEPIPVITHPLKGRSSISTVDFISVEGGVTSKRNYYSCFPELDPLGNSIILINDFTLFKAEILIGVN